MHYSDWLIIPAIKGVSECFAKSRSPSFRQSSAYARHALSQAPAPHPNPLPEGERGMRGVATVERRARGAAAAFRLRALLWLWILLLIFRVPLARR